MQKRGLQQLCNKYNYDLLKSVMGQERDWLGRSCTTRDNSRRGEVRDMGLASGASLAEPDSKIMSQPERMAHNLCCENLKSLKKSGLQTSKYCIFKQFCNLYLPY